LVQYRSDYIAVKFHTAQEISRRHNLSDRPAPLGYDQWLASARDSVQEREAVRFEMSGRYGFGLLFQVTFYDHEEHRSTNHCTGEQRGARKGTGILFRFSNVNMMRWMVSKHLR